jgi:16S rRNA (adenine1518-N6/adenine1519-N6)-dimethyltransferase
MGRRLGQHFLRPASVERLLRLLAPEPGQVFLEIGAGQGALTLPLAARARHVVAVELDQRLADGLAARAPANVEVVRGDALELDLATLVPRGGRLVGNLPYAISSPLLRRFLDLRGHVVDLHVMLQLEVAQRLAATPGTKDYGIFSILYGLWADVDIPLRFAPACFSPPPKVQSAILRARLHQSPRHPVGDAAALETLLRRAFAHRRKTLENNLALSYHNLKQHLRLLDILGSRRAETLSIVEFAKLSTALSGEKVDDG